MFLFATSQAIAATQTKQGQGKARRHDETQVERPRHGRSLLWRIFYALARSRMRQAPAELEQQRRLPEGGSKK
jgi:hypothetical protein